MEDDVVTLERLQRAFKNVSFKVKSMETAVQFMKSKNLGKCCSNRFLSWLVYFEAIPSDPALWPETFYHIIRNYRNKLSYFVKPKQEIPIIIGKEQTDNIINDVKRCQGLFTDLISEIGVPVTMCDDAETRISRVICFMINDAPQYSFLQGYDRLASVSFALALHFSLRIQLSLIEAEAFAVVLLRQLVTLCEPAKFLTNPNLSMQYYVDLDAFLMQHNLELMQTLNRGYFRSEHFAANWVGSLFADCHKPLDTLVIWDYMILNKANVSDFTKALVSTHLDQIETNDDPSTVISNIMSYQDWDVERIVDDAKYLLSTPYITKQLLTSPLGFWI